MEKNQATEDIILKAATQIFLKKGKEGARMAEIAKTAGINQALLHYYFRSKAGLYHAVAEQQIRAFFSELFRKVPETEGFQKFLRAFIENYHRHLAANPALPRFILWELQRSDTSITQILQDMLKSFRASPVPFFDVVEAAIAGGEIRPVNPRHLMMSLIGSCLFPFAARPVVETVFGVPGVADPAFLESRKQAIFDLIWESIRSR